MFRIDNINRVNNKIAFKQNQADTVSNPINSQVNQLSDIKPDFAVKTPMSYSKLTEIDFPYGIKAHIYKLSNGQKVIIVPQEGETVLKTYVNTGSMNEPDNVRGISHYIEHNLFNGSVGLEQGDFFKQVDKMGASTNASTGFAETNYYISSNLLNDTDLENKIKLHSAMLESPLFLAEKLEKEKDIVNSEINMITSDPQNIAINKMLRNLYGIKTTSSDMIGGTTENINNLTRDDVLNYFSSNYYPSNMVTVITGDVEPEKTMELVSKYFSSNKTQPANRYFEKLSPVQEQIREDITSDKATSASVVIGFDGAKPADIKDTIYSEALALLLTNISTSRITSKLQEYNGEAICQTEKISSNPNDGKTLIFMAECNDDSSEKALKDIFTEIGNISTNPPTDAEMKIVKKKMLKSFSSIFEDSFSTNTLLGTSVLENCTDYIKDYEKIVNEMTSEDLVNAAKKYLDLNKVSVCVVHPKENKSAGAVSFTGLVNKNAIDMSKVTEYSFDNNYRLSTINTKTNNVEILYKLDTDIDFKCEPAANLVLSEILNDGSMLKSRNDMNFELAQKGISRGYSTSSQSISASISCDIDGIKDSVDNIKEVLFNPRFTQDSFEHAKKVVKDNILTREKSATDKLNQEIFKGFPKGYSKDDILKSIDRLTLDDVKMLHYDLMLHSKGMISVAAPFENNSKLKKELFSSVASLNKVQPFKIAQLANKYSPVDKVKVLTDTDYKNQAEIVQAYKFKMNENIKDAVTLDLLNIILGGNPSSRLFIDLRENEKLAYHVKSSFSRCEDTGLLTMKILTTTDNKETGEQHFDNLQKSIDGFKKHVDKLVSEKVTDDELQNAKLSLKNSILNSNHSSLDKASSVLSTLDSSYGTQKINMIFEEIDKISAEDLSNAANYVFKTKPVYSILATEDTLKANEEYLDNLKL